MNTPALERLRAFRQHIYTTCGCRRDALGERLDALLTTAVIEHPVQSPLGSRLESAPGAVSLMPSLLEPCRCLVWSIWWQQNPWRPAQRGMPSLPGSGRAAMPKPALSVAPPMWARAAASHLHLRCRL